MKVIKEEMVYQSPVIEELELVNEGFVFSTSEEDDDEGVGGEGNLGGETGWGTPLIEVTMGGIAYLLEYSLSFKPGYAHTINLILNTSPDQEKIEISIDAGTGEWN